MERMTAVPDPRFRDQLAELVATHTPDLIHEGPNGEDDGQHLYCVECGVLPIDDHGLQYAPVHVAERIEVAFAAEVEARVQAAVNQRAAAMRALADELNREADRTVDITARIAMRDVAARAAALASPAPAPRAEEEQR